ncbi:heme biosynthesis HemY N-terminal domain-containing protein [Nitrogeniibacter mangrovi]|nr:heme biosynthesis HemY N-terminal domain-containing protein [Nitrogeniibacter mangrovi]
MLASVNDGYALLVLPPYRAQVSLNFLVLAILAVVLAVYFLVGVISRALRLPGKVVAYRDRRRRERAAESLRDAVRLQLEGRYSQALKMARKSWGAGDPSGVSALVAARAAHALRDDQRYREWIGHAAERDDKILTARLMTEAEMAVEGRRFDEAARCVDAMKTNDNRPVATLQLALQIAEAKDDWKAVVKIARQLRKHHLLADEQARPLVRRAHVASMRALDGQGEAIVAYWNGMPAEEQNDPSLVEKVVPLMVANGQGATVRRVLESQLDAQWDSRLARLYGECGDHEPVSAIARAEKWLQAHPKDSGLLYALGRLCVAAELWGKAQSYLEASVSAAPSVDAHLTLAQLSERFERPQVAQDHYRRAAQLTAHAAGGQLALPATEGETA